MAPGAQASTNSSSSSSSTRTNGGNNGKSFVQKYLTNCKSFYSCIYCRTHLANHDELVSRSFQGNRSRAYLFNSVINISCGPAVQRELNTGSHAVADIFCANCGTTMGWKYEKAYVETQKYKEGKYIIELAHVVRENRHLEFDKRDMFLGLNNSNISQPQRTAVTAPSLNHCHQGSLSPASSNGQWSSPASSSSNDDELDDDDDEELMFPFYDDFGADRSSYPGLSSSRLHHKRVRRSLYLDSTPYDWKYSASTSTATSPVSPVSPPSPLCSVTDPSRAANGEAQMALTLGSALCFSDLSPSTSSLMSSSEDSPEIKRKNSYLRNTDNSGDTANTCNNNKSDIKSISCEQCESRESDDNETQFKFEAESHSDIAIINADHPSPSSHQLGGQQIGKKYGRPIILESAMNSTAPSGENNLKCQEVELYSTIEITSSQNDNLDNPKPSTPNIVTGEMCRTNSMSLDDEEFYDCCTDHDISNSLPTNLDIPKQNHSHQNQG